MKVAKLNSVAVIGAGLMGHGIAQQCVLSGYQKVVLHDSNEKALEKGMGAIRASLLKLKEKGKLGTSTPESLIGCIKPSIKLDSVKGNDIIIEAIIENLDIKKKIWGDIGLMCAKDNTIFATNTSSFPVGVIGDASKRPDRMVGLHFFNPVQIMKLVEVIKTPKTDEAVFKTTFSFAESLQKTPVVCADTPGFIVNRLLVPYLASAMQMLDDKVGTAADIDVAMKLGASHPMGPLQLADYVGLDTCLAILKGWKTAYPSNPAFFVPKCLEDLVKEGKLGKKSGKGFYTY